MNGKRLLAFGAHPDDIEFGCGALLLDAAEQGGEINLAVLSRGESGTQGDRTSREKEAEIAAKMLRAELYFLSTAGDTRIRADQETSLEVAKLIRRVVPDIILAPTGHPNQHPDHRETSLIVRDAHRLARYGKTPGLEALKPHASQLLLFYDISTVGSEFPGQSAVLVDISKQVEKWKRLMECHESQIKNMDYIDLQLSRARTLGIQLGVHSAVQLYSEGPLLINSSTDLVRLKSLRF